MTDVERISYAREVPVPWLQETLVKSGAYLGDTVNRRVQRGEGARR